MKNTITELLESFPPCVIRLLAREGKGRGAKRLTHEDIAKRSGLSYEKVRDISPMKSWDKVAIADDQHSAMDLLWFQPDSEAPPVPADVLFRGIANIAVLRGQGGSGLWREVPVGGDARRSHDVDEPLGVPLFKCLDVRECRCGVRVALEQMTRAAVRADAPLVVECARFVRLRVVDHLGDERPEIVVPPVLDRQFYQPANLCAHRSCAVVDPLAGRLASSR